MRAIWPSGVAMLWFSAGFADQVPILVRLYGAHVVIIPCLVLLLVAWYALLVKRLGRLEVRYKIEG